jgi:general secretion pathway protein E
MGLIPLDRLYTSTGCEKCNHSGYRGRTGIYELLQVNEAMRKLIHEGASEDALRAHAAQEGMASLRQDGVRWLRDGTTSLAELMRVTRS